MGAEGTCGLPQVLGQEVRGACSRKEHERTLSLYSAKKRISLSRRPEGSLEAKNLHSLPGPATLQQGGPGPLF